MSSHPPRRGGARRAATACAPAPTIVTLLLLLPATSLEAQSPRRVALTFDDLPANTMLGPGAYRALVCGAAPRAEDVAAQYLAYMDTITGYYEAQSRAIAASDPCGAGDR